MAKTIGWFLVLVALAGVGGFVYVGANASSQGETFTVTQGSVRRSLRGTGRLEGVGETPLSFPMTGQIKEVYFRDGQEVSAGQTLAELMPEHMQKRIQVMESQLNEAEAQLESVKTPVSPEAIKQQEEKVKQADDVIRSAELKIEALNLPPTVKRAPEWQVEESARLVERYKTELEVAKLDLKKASSSTSPEERALTEQEVEGARIALETAKGMLLAKKGETVFFGSERKSKAELEADVVRAEQNLKLAEAKRDVLLKGPNKEDVRSAELKVKLAENALTGAEATLKRMQAPEAAAAKPIIEIRQAEIALSQAKAAKRQEEAALEDLKRGPDPAKIKAAEAAVERAKTQLSLAKLEKDGLSIRAPRDGMITKCIAETGMLTNAHTPMFYIVDFSKKRVRAEFDISRLTELAKDQPVSVTSRAMGKESLEGKVLEVGRVGPRRLTNDDPSAPKGGEIVEVIIAIEPEQNESKRKIYDSLRPNVPVEAEVFLERRDKVLVIPRSYVSNVNGQEIVQLLPRSNAGKGEKPTAKAVKTGMKDETYVEVIEGLAEGDVVMKPVAQNGR